MMKKAKIKFEGKIYWLNLGTNSFDDFEMDVLENGKWRPVMANEVDLFGVMETGVVIGDSKN